jgi:hypothetical protein
MPKDSEYGISGCELRVGTKTSKEILTTGIPHFTVWRQRVPVHLIYQDGGNRFLHLIYQDGGNRFLYAVSTKMEATGSCMSFLPRWRQQVPVCLIYQDGGNRFLYVLSTKMEARFLYVLSTEIEGAGSFRALASLYQATPSYIEEETI